MVSTRRGSKANADTTVETVEQLPDATVTEIPDATVTEVPETPEETSVEAPVEETSVEAPMEAPVEETSGDEATDWDALLETVEFEDVELRHKRPTVAFPPRLKDMVESAYKNKKRGTLPVKDAKEFAHFKLMLQSAGDSIDKSVHVTEHKDKVTGNILGIRFTVGERRGRNKK